MPLKFWRSTAFSEMKNIFWISKLEESNFIICSADAAGSIFDILNTNNNILSKTLFEKFFRLILN